MQRTFRRDVARRQFRGSGDARTPIGGFVVSELTLVLLVLAIMGGMIMLAVPGESNQPLAGAGDLRPIRSMATAERDGRIVAVLTDEECLTHDLSDGSVTPIWLRQGEARICAIAGSPIAPQVLICSDERAVELVDVSTADTVWGIKMNIGRPRCAAFSTDGRTAVACSDAGEILLLDATTGHEKLRLSVGFDVSAVCFTSDGRSLIAPDGCDSLAAWDVATAKRVQRFESRAGSILSLAVSPNGREVAATTCEGAVLRWDLASGRMISRFQESSLPSLAVVWSPESESLICASTTGMICEAGGTDAVERSWLAHRAGVRDLVFAQGQLVSAGYDGRVLQWSADRTSNRALAVVR